MASMCITHYDKQFLQRYQKAKASRGKTNFTMMKRALGHMNSWKHSSMSWAYMCYSQNTFCILRLKGHSYKRQAEYCFFFQYLYQCQVLQQRKEN